MDQVAFEPHRLTGRNQLMQCVWVYHTEVDVDALQGVCDRMRMLRTNQLIEPSGVPFGRPRWVRDDRSTLPVRIGETVLPRAALMAWANAHARTPIDPVTGPAWHISLQRFSDGTSAVSMVGSHVLLDGVFALKTVRLAIAKTRCIRTTKLRPPSRIGSISPANRENQSSKQACVHVCDPRREHASRQQ